MIRILATTDIHGNFGQVPRQNALINQLDNGSAIRVNTGDSQTCRSPKNWPLASSLDDAAKYDVRILGNHETFLGEEDFAKSLSRDSTPYLATTLDQNQVSDWFRESLLKSG